MKTLIKARCTDRSSRSESREFNNEIIGQKPLLYGALIIAPIMSIFLMKLSKIDEYCDDFIFFNTGLTITLMILVAIIGLVFKYYRTAEYKMHVIAFLSIAFWFSILKFKIFSRFFEEMNTFDIFGVVLSIPTVVIIGFILWVVFCIIFLLLDQYISNNDLCFLQIILGECNIRLLYISIFLGSLLPLLIILVFSSNFINTSYMSFLVSYFYYIVFVLFSLHENIPEYIFLREGRGTY